MAVDAHQLPFFPSQLTAAPTRELLAVTPMDDFNQSNACGDAPVGFHMGMGKVPFYSNGAAADAAAVSGLTFAGVPSVSNAIYGQDRKRQRGDLATDHQNSSPPSSSIPSFLGADFSSLLRQQQLEVELLVSQHMERVRLEVSARRRLLAQRMLAAVEQAAAQRLKEKEAEISSIAGLNTALAERARSLAAEAQVWRDLARSNEAAAQALRADLDQALLLAGQQQQDTHGHCGGAAAAAESCCDNGEEEEQEAAGKRRRVMCRGCECEEPGVLLLPCRHLCLCSACAAQACVCPVCGCAAHRTVLVNFS